MNRPKDFTCECCFFFRPKKETEGRCHRFPPKNVLHEAEGDLGVDEFKAEFPIVEIDDWCGEYRSES